MWHRGSASGLVNCATRIARSDKRQTPPVIRQRIKDLRITICAGCILISGLRDRNKWMRIRIKEFGLRQSEKCCRTCGMWERCDGMRVVLVMNRKGGSGKSTLCRALASAAVARGETVTIFDTDSSKSCLNRMRAGQTANFMRQRSFMDRRRATETVCPEKIPARFPGRPSCAASLSPRLRGTVHSLRQVCPCVRFIPACAGNSLPRRI